MKIITLASQKGGVGKSTLAINIYSTFVHNGARTAIVDTDPQGSIRNTYETLKGSKHWGDINIISSEELKIQLEKPSPDYDVIVIDTPPYLSENLETILSISDVVLVPCKPSPFDALSLGSTLSLIEDAQAKNKDLKSAIVLNMTIQGTKKYTEQILEILKANYNCPILRTQIKNRVAYSRAIFKDSSVDSEYNKKASQEITALIQEMLIL